MCKLVYRHRWNQLTGNRAEPPSVEASTAQVWRRYSQFSRSSTLFVRIYIRCYDEKLQQIRVSSINRHCTLLRESVFGAISDWVRYEHPYQQVAPKKISVPKTQEPQRFLGFFVPFFKVEFKRYHFLKTTFGEDLNYRPRLSGADFAEFFARSAPFFVSGFVKCLCLGGCA